MPISWNIPLVLVSILVAMIGSFTSLTHAQRMRESKGMYSRVWLCTGGLTLGVAIWTMHFIGMLAFHLPIPIAYDIPLTLLSGVLAVAAALLGFYLLCTPDLRIGQIVGGSVLMGLGISAMHYTGMAALKMSPPLDYSLPIVALSTLIAILAALGALLIVYAREKNGWNYWLRYGAGGVIMGLAISGMHYTAMATAEFPEGSICLSGASRIAPDMLTLLVSMGALTLFAGGMLASMFDQRMAWQKSLALEQLQSAHTELGQRAQHLAETMNRELRESHDTINHILDTIPQSVCWKDRNGVYLGCNRAFARDAGLTHPDEVIGKTDFDLPWTREESEAHRAGDHEVMCSNAARLHIIERQHNAQGEHIWVDTSKVPLADGEVFGVLGVYQNITERMAAEAKIKRLTELYAALSQCNQAIVRCTNEDELFPQICRDAVQFGGMKMAWIGLVDQASQTVKPVSAFGAGMDYLDGLQISVNADDPSGRGPTGISIRENRPFWCQDYLNEPLLALWHERGASSGWGASASLPLHRKGRVIGTFTLYAGEVDAFDEPARNLLMEMAMDIDYALDSYILQAERNLAEEVLRESEARTKLTLDMAMDAVISADQDGRVIGWNREAERMFGYATDQTLGRDLSELIVPPAHRQSHRLGMQRFVKTGIATTIGKRTEITAMRADGSEFPIELTIAVIQRQGRYLFNAFVRDITERKQSEQEIHQLAFYDPLTRLPNRRLLLDRLQQAMSVSMRNGHHGAVLFLDLDYFKTINDTQGHAVGDLLLIEVARRLQTCVREGDSVARLGGDEFVVLLEELSSDANEAASQTELVAEKIRIELGQPYELKNYECLTTPSIGISLFRGHLESIDDLLKHADVAMYQAKTSGRNAIRFFDPGMQAILETRAELQAALRHALQRQQFRLYYQVQVDSLRRPLGAEVLLRWEHPERGLVAPMQFIPLAEETGLIVPIGLWVLETACVQLKAWQNDALTRDLTLAVNVSAKQFRHADFVAQVQQVLSASGAKPSRLKLELTESVVLENVEDTIVKMRELKLLGVSFSMDDFGTGHSSLSYLKRLPLDQIKIDQSFVRDIASDPNDAAIVQTIIAMTETLGLNVIAEGVETESQLDFLELRGCHAYQGYLFGRPVPLGEFETLLSKDLRHDAEAEIIIDVAINGDYRSILADAST